MTTSSRIGSRGVKATAVLAFVAGVFTSGAIDLNSVAEGQAAGRLVPVAGHLGGARCGTTPAFTNQPERGDLEVLRFPADTGAVGAGGLMPVIE